MRSAAVAGTRFHILENTLRIDRPLIDLHDHALSIHQERRRNPKVSAPVEEIAIDDVVDSRYILGCEENRERKPFCVANDRALLTAPASSTLIARTLHSAAASP